MKNRTSKKVCLFCAARIDGERSVTGNHPVHSLAGILPCLTGICRLWPNVFADKGGKSQAFSEQVAAEIGEGNGT